MSTLEKAIMIATQAHTGQRDKAGAPYILHPLRVMMKVKTETEMIVAVLHDIIEDTDYSLDILKQQGFSQTVLDALGCLTKREDESYEEFIERVKQNPIAVKVKIADLEDNMDTSRFETLTDADVARIKKYKKAHETLQLVSNQAER